MNIKPKHLQFCMAYLQTSDPGVAYKMTYPKAGMKSLYAAASRLMARPEVSAWIEDTREMMQQRILREIQADQVQAKKEQLLSINEKRNVLTRIITGEAKRSRHIKTKYGVTKVEDDQPVYAILRAIDMDTRLENFHNYLIHRDSWGKTPVLHINPPTLQQQVNILVAQATKEEIPEGHKTIPLLTKEGSMDVLPPAEEVHSGEVAPAQETQPVEPSYLETASCLAVTERRVDDDEKVPSPLVERAEGEVSPASNTSLLPPFEGRIEETTNSSFEGGAAGGGCPLTQEKAPSPRERAEGNEKAPLLTKEGRMDVLPPAEEVHSGEVAPAQVKKHNFPVSNPIYLTKLNKRACEFVNANKNLPQVNKNATLSPGEGRDEAKKRIFAPYSQPARE